MIAKAQKSGILRIGWAMSIAFYYSEMEGRNQIDEIPNS
jgi:hypothetical protein